MNQIPVEHGGNAAVHVFSGREAGAGSNSYSFYNWRIRMPMMIPGESLV